MGQSAIQGGRRIKVRGGNLGAFLCWAVVFADIGTSIYYVPGILYGPFGNRAAIFVLMTLCVFVLLCIKYAEVTRRRRSRRASGVVLACKGLGRRVGQVRRRSARRVITRTNLLL